MEGRGACPYLADFSISEFSNFSLLEHFSAKYSFSPNYGVKVRDHLENELWILLTVLILGS